MSTVNQELLAQMREQLDRNAAGSKSAEERLNRYSAMSTELRQVEATASSPDRSVTVVAGPGGSIKNIQLTDDIRRMSPTQLSSTIMGTLRQALALAARNQAEIVQETVGNTNVLDKVLATQEQVFGTPSVPPAPEPSHPGPPQRYNAPPPPPRAVARRRPAPRPEDEGDAFQGFGGVNL